MEGFSLNIREIHKYQKNRYPYLLIDRITGVVPGKHAKGYKNITMNEWYMPTHYVDDPFMPGMLSIESLVQVFIMTFLTLPEYKGKATNFLGADNIKFTKRLEPGDRLDIESELLSLKRGIAKGYAKGYVDGKPACQSNFVIGIPEEFQKFSPVPPKA